jgi:glycosyltransferase involved in cell wall biosynthesis
VTNQLDKPKKTTLLIISHVVPTKPSSGQQQRVLQMLKEGSKRFRVVLLLVDNNSDSTNIREELEKVVDRVIILPSLYNVNLLARIWYSTLAFMFRLQTGLKKSNYVIGEVEFTEQRIALALEGEDIDLVIYEYWHAWKTISYFRKKNIPVILDMHDMLQNAYKEQLNQNKLLPSVLKTRAIKKYQAEEHRAWNHFDGIIAINQIEKEELQKKFPQKQIYFCPMALDLQLWKYSYAPLKPRRFGFYGGLSSPVNLRQALFTINSIMPLIWDDIPDAELWLIGNKPGKELITSSNVDRRIIVTGYLLDTQRVLSTLTALICPWPNIFGFRTRIIEVMSLGIPVIASPEAFAGMGLTDNNGIFSAESPQDFANIAKRLSSNPDFSKQQSLLARASIENGFTTEKTYQKLFEVFTDFYSNKSLTGK